VIARAAGPAGVSLSEVALDLGVDEVTIIEDLREVEERDLYHRAGEADDFRIVISADRVRVRTVNDLSRPTKLTPPEALALWMGLEVVRMSGAPSTRAREELRARLRRHLVQQSEAVVEAPFAAPSLAHDPKGLRRIISEAASNHRVCSITYVKPGAERPESRRVRPYVVIHAEGSWYVLGHCERADAVRAFSIDRVLDAVVEGEHFEPPVDFDPAAHLDVGGGRVLDARRAVEALVRYSSRIARWIAEREEGEWQPDGALLVRHRVADSDWLVRHILRYAGEAEVVEPAELRARVHDAARRLVAAGES
jgi:predicted DNA-binding transcriptional regulator YafY